MQRVAIGVVGAAAAAVGAAAAAVAMMQPVNVHQVVNRAWIDSRSAEDIMRLKRIAGPAPNTLARDLADTQSIKIWHGEETCCELVESAVMSAQCPRRAAELVVDRVLAHHHLRPAFPAIIAHNPPVPVDAVERYLETRVDLDIEVVQRLIVLGSDSGPRALKKAVLSNRTDIAELLMRLGADPMVPVAGTTSLQLALTTSDAMADLVWAEVLRRSETRGENLTDGCPA
jgi:hypothetical protein